MVLDWLKKRSAEFGDWWKERSAFDNEEKEKMEKERLAKEEYIKNLGIEYSFGCLKENRADSCHRHGEYLEQLQSNFADAFQTYKKNCEVRKYPASCLRYAKYLIAGKECTPSMKDACEPMRVACEGKLPDACRYLGLLYHNLHGSKAASDLEKYMHRACDLEDGKACWLLNVFYLGPVKGIEVMYGQQVDTQSKEVLPRNPKLALEYGIRGCELGIFQSCINVSRMYDIGDGIKKDAERAEEFKGKAKKLVDFSA